MVLFRRYEGRGDALSAVARGGLRAIPFFILGAAIIWVIVDSESLEACVSKPSRAQAYKALHENLAVFHFSVRIYRHCLFGLANKAANGITALATVVVAVFTVTLWQVGRYQHAVAMEALNISRNDFESQHRPWVPDNLQVASDLVYGENGPQITIQFNLRNTGSVPAIKVFPFFDLVIAGEYKKTRETIAQRIDSGTHVKSNLVINIFPVSPIVAQRIGVTLAKDIIDAKAAEHGGFREFPLQIFGAIIYMGPTGKIYQTGFNYAVSFIDPKIGPRNLPEYGFMFQ